MTEYDSIDDILANPPTKNPSPILDEPSEPRGERPVSPEEKATIKVPQESFDDEPKEPIKTENSKSEYSDSEADLSSGDDSSDELTDDYGNPKPKARMYTEEEHKEILNRAIRDRLARGNHGKNEESNSRNTPPETSGDDNWEAQLEQFVETTLKKISTKEAQAQQRMKEEQAYYTLQSQIQEGLHRFNDFETVVGRQPITDAMTAGLRGMSDPAGFLYAAAKKAPQELERISRLDPYSQVREIGKLEDRLKAQRSTTKAPRPLGQTKNDGVMPREREPQEPTIEDLIAQADAKRRAMYKDRRR